MEDWETESLSLCVGSQVRLKAEWVDRWHERLDDVERRTRHRGVLGHVTPVHTHTHSTHNVHRSDVTNSGEQRSVAVCFHCLKFCTQDGFIVTQGFTRHYGVHKKPAFDGICSPRMSHLQVCISDKINTVIITITTAMIMLTTVHTIRRLYKTLNRLYETFTRLYKTIICCVCVWDLRRASTV